LNSEGEEEEKEEGEGEEKDEGEEGGDDTFGWT
jgi:hypothetical protein